MRKRIGELLVESGLITPVQRQEILDYSRKSGLRFGEAAQALKFIREEQLVRLFGKNFRTDFFYLDPAHFPRETREFLSAEQILAFGALPLGMKQDSGFFRKRRLLNVGLLDPSREDALEEVRKIAATKGFDGIQVFLILADQLIGILRSEFGISDRELSQRPQDTLDPVLSMFLEREGNNS